MLGCSAIFRVPLFFRHSACMQEGLLRKTDAPHSTYLLLIGMLTISLPISMHELLTEDAALKAMSASDTLHTVRTSRNMSRIPLRVTSNPVQRRAAHRKTSFFFASSFNLASKLLAASTLRFSGWLDVEYIFGTSCVWFGTEMVTIDPELGKGAGAILPRFVRELYGSCSCERLHGRSVS